MARVETVMKSAMCCRPDDTARDCARLMKEENIGFVPVCNEADEPVGTITDRDLALRILAEGRLLDAKLEDVMTPEVVSCKIGDDLRDAERLMREHRKSRIMVCDEEGRLQGVISLSDIAEEEDEEVAGRTLREVASREISQPHAS
ncbi:MULTISPECIES: CBS domain-containing protein [unclassified Anaeromyxobacter]|nr:MULTISPECIES: CBS domain-containing protein [unclassified Anaeromyxobacter]